MTVVATGCSDVAAGSAVGSQPRPLSSPRVPAEAFPHQLLPTRHRAAGARASRLPARCRPASSPPGRRGSHVPALLLLPPGPCRGEVPLLLLPPPRPSRRRLRVGPHSLARESVHFPQDLNQHSGAGRGPRKQDALEARWLTARRMKAAPS